MEMETLESFVARSRHNSFRNAEGFIKFMIAVFGARELKRLANEGKILHAELEIDGTVITLADCGEEEVPTAGLNIYVSSPDDIYYKAVESGAEPILDPADRRFGRSCGFRDPYGNLLWVTDSPEN